MPLTGSQLNRIHHAVLGAYTRDELKRTVRICMDASFDDIAPDKAFADQVWALIEWANRQDRVNELVRCVHDNNKTNAEVAALWRDARTWDWTEHATATTAGGATTSGQNVATVSGSGAIAQGPGAVAAGQGGIAVGGNVQGGISVGSTAKPNEPKPES